jgi:hypothetical protein
MNSSDSQLSHSSSSRFSLILLEPGEIYYEDYLVYYYGLKCPFTTASTSTNYFETSSVINNRFENKKSTILSEESSSNFKPLKGNLKICSKSVVFDPIDLNSPLIKFQYKSIEKIEQFNEISDYETAEFIRSSNKRTESFNSYDNEFDDIYSSSIRELRKNSSLEITQNETTINFNQLKKKCFAINAKQVIHCMQNNKIAPYNVLRRQDPADFHYFQFIFTNSNGSFIIIIIIIIIIFNIIIFKKFKKIHWI